MASLVLGVAGAAIAGQVAGGAATAVGFGITAGQIGLAVGGTVGSIVDSLLLFPAIFGNTADQRGPRLADLELSLANEGTDMPWCFGQYNRVGGTVIYLSDLIETSTTSNAGGGGKGGPSPSVTEYTYSVHMECAFGEASSGPGILKKVYLDSKVLYELDETSAKYQEALDIIETNGTATTKAQIDGKLGQQGTLTATYNVGYRPTGRFTTSYPDVTSVVINASFSVTSGQTIRFAGHDNYTYTVSADSSPSSGELTISFSPALRYTSTLGDIVYVDRVYNLGKQATDVRINYGTQDQVPDTLLEGLLGSSNVSGNNGIIKATFENLDLSDWGNRVPQVRGEVAEPYQYIKDVIAKLCERCGLSSSQYDVSKVYGCTRGFAAVGPQRTHKVMESILQVYDISTFIDNNTLHFFTRGFETATVINEADLVSDVQFGTSSYLDLPDKVIVSYGDADRDMQSGSLVEGRMSRPGNNTETLDVPFVMSSEQARLFAQRRLYRSWTETRSVEFQLKPKWSYYLQPGDHITLTYEDGNTFKIRCDVVTTGKYMQCEIEGVVTKTNMVDNSTTVEAPPTSATGLTDPADLTSVILDIAPLRLEDANRAIGYAAASTNTTDDVWKGATVLRELSTNQFNTKNSIFVENKMATVSTALAAPVTAAVWDYKNTFDAVFLSNHVPESKTKKEVLDGEGHWLLGGEVVGVATWTQVSGQTYRASTLMRGRRNTSTSHSADETLTELNTSLEPVDIGTSLINDSPIYRIVPALAPTSAGDQILLDPYEGNSVKPFDPTCPVFSRDGSNNITISWTRRTRVPVFICNTPIPLDEPFEKYTVVFKTTGDVELRSVTVEDVTTATYTAAEQTSDGHTPGDPVNITIKQLGLYNNSDELSLTNQ